MSYDLSGFGHVNCSTIQITSASRKTANWGWAGQILGAKPSHHASMAAIVATTVIFRVFMAG